MNRFLPRFPLLLALLAVGHTHGAAPPPPEARLPPAAKARIYFVRDVRPILSARCYRCHGPTKQVSGLALNRKQRALEGGDSGPAIVPGNGAASRLVRYVAGLDPDHLMPPTGKGRRLTPAQVGLLRAWIDQGAQWPASADVLAESEHWAYRKPVRPPLPAVKNIGWVRNGLDYFILARLEKEGLRPSPEAERAVLIRRLYLDLIGLPPTVAEVDEFLADNAPGAYERLVDRLLASPRYGERWARPWLDLARYADTNGYEKDKPRTIWPWRDWVIAALNADMPFDQFSIEQLAGDLLPNATLAQKIATGFHRNSMLNDEGGINAEEFRVVAVKDRVDTTATVWLGTTLECAQCHSHKYDPFSQREYYQFYAFFNQTADSGVGNGPEVSVPTAAEKAKAQRLQADLTSLEKALRERDKRLVEDQAEWEANVRKGPRPAAAPTKGLHLHYRLDGGKGRAIPDASGKGRNGTFKGKALPVWEGRALVLDGSGAHIDGSGANFQHTEAFSYGAWVKAQTRSGCVLSKIDDPKGYRGFDLFFNDGRFEAHFVHAWPADAMKVFTKRSFAPGAWHHVFVTYDGSGKAAGVRIYVDGKVEELTIEKDALKGSIKTSVSFKVGRRHVMGAFKGAIGDVRVYERLLSADEVRALAARHPALDILNVPPAKRTPQQKADLTSYQRAQDFVRNFLLAGIEETKSDLAKVGPVKTMVMVERSPRRQTYLLRRGDFRQNGPRVEPGVPAALHPFPADYPRNRLGLARWLVSRDNPLVARVTVNRFWQTYFGQGLVKTPEDFGSQGEKPTHPELLDWLAVEFMDRGWSMKALHRLIVTSATYRQSSAVSAELLRVDPRNELYGRAPRPRVDAETLRDLALSAGGLLSAKFGGPSVMPPQPDGIWENSFGFYDLPNFRWKTAEDEDRYRRGIYTFLRRTALYPTYLMFDGPGRDVCSVSRPRTNTPLQALATLNDPVFVEAAGGLARRTLREGGDTASERATFAFRVCVARRPDGAEVKAIVALYERARARFVKDEKAAERLVKHARVAVLGRNMTEVAAWTVVANVLLNLDETMTRG
jgi:hypothetical protein